jgi:RNA 2',3'-cyclic 3'-phosphodiesterase
LTTKQASLPGFDPLPALTDSLFFAILPDAAAASRIAQIAQQFRSAHGLKGKTLPADRFHVTLHHLGNYAGLPQDIVATAGEVGASVANAMPAFELAFDCAESFSSTPRNRPLVLRGGDGLIALTGFQQALGTPLKRTAVRPWLKPGYTPHLTLLYDDHAVFPQAIEPITWTARELVLVHSLVGQGQHVHLGQWALNG